MVRKKTGGILQLADSMPFAQVAKKSCAPS
jgi:hypothetical protein